MNLFRSEEHARNWHGFEPAMETSLRPLAEWADIFSNALFRERGRADFISWMRSDAGRSAYRELGERLPRATEQ